MQHESSSGRLDAAGARDTTDEVDVVGGWFSRAAGGTLFLDELEGMSQALQERLCAALCYPLETSHDHHTVRVITGARPAWPTALERQQFSDRLYYRLNVMRVDCVDLSHDWALEGFAQMDPIVFAPVVGFPAVAVDAPGRSRGGSTLMAPGETIGDGQRFQ